MLVSIITVSFNSEKTIRNTIESVLNQEYDNIQYLIIDGASKDHTVQVAMEYEAQFQAKGYEYKVVSEPDHGIYDAMNKGIRLADGGLIGIINSDDWYENHAVKVAAEEYQKNHYDMFYADINLIKKDGTIIVKHSKKDRFPTSRHWNHPTTFIPKAVYNEVGLYRCEGIHDDFDLVLRIRRAGKKIIIKNDVLANFRVGGASNDKSFEKCKQRYRDRYSCYRNNKYSRLYAVECLAIEVVKFIVS